MMGELDNSERRESAGRRDLEGRRELLDRRLDEIIADSNQRVSKTRRKMNDRRILERRDDG